MTFALALTAVTAFLSAAVIVIFAIVVAAIRSGDRAKNLTRAPRTRTEQATRRLLGVGIRTTTGHAVARPGAQSSPSLPGSDLP
jgi:hypothetical protein